MVLLISVTLIIDTMLDCMIIRRELLEFECVKKKLEAVDISLRQFKFSRSVQCTKSKYRSGMFLQILLDAKLCFFLQNKRAHYWFFLGVSSLDFTRQAVFFEKTNAFGIKRCLANKSLPQWVACP